MINLTKGQKVVYTFLVSTPLTRQQIANKLFVTPDAVSSQVNKILVKMEKANRIELMHDYYENKLKEKG